MGERESSIDNRPHIEVQTYSLYGGEKYAATKVYHSINIYTVYNPINAEGEGVV